MRAILGWGAVSVLGLAMGVGCSSGEDLPSKGATASASFAGQSGSNDAGEAGTAAGGCSPTSQPDPGLPEAGAGGACAGDYACPSVAYGSSATIAVDLPVSVSDALEAQFTACRNSECHSGPGKNQLSPDGWESGEAQYIQLKLDDSGGAPAAHLAWVFFDGVAGPSDHYSLTIQPVGAATATTLFDAPVTYKTTVSDPTLACEGYCRHCSEVLTANVDARAKP